MDLLNPETVESFQELMEPDELQDFLQRAHQELLRTHGLLQQHFADSEWGALRAAAHRLKGSLGSIGCDALFAELERLEMQLMETPPRLPTAANMVELSDLVGKTAERLAAVC